MDELAKRFADLAEKYGPTVVDAALQAARIEAYSTLAAGVLLLVIGVFLIWLGWKAWNQEWCMEEAVLLPIIVWLAAALLVLLGLWFWIDPWTWTALNHPELWIAKKAFHL